MILIAACAVYGQVHSLPRAMGISEAVDSANVSFAVADEEYVRTAALSLIPSFGGEPWMWQFLPDGLIYHSYLAGVKEPRMGVVFNSERTTEKRYLDTVIGARFGLWRYGTGNDARPEGWQVDLEAAAFPRLDVDLDRELVSTDFRFGVPLTFGRGAFQLKLAYYHLSSHLGDEFLLRTMRPRINFSRDVAVGGISLYLTDNIRVYGEAGWAFVSDGQSEPWEFQFGAEFSPAVPSTVWGAPFLAVNAHLRQELDYSGNIVVQAGWQWRARHGTRLLRIGGQYYNGKSQQYEFFDEHEELVGLGVWYDF